ncbi:MAG: hypothetical protein ACI8UZ_000789 [Akkermansiaceae bacterium]|jgi:hypothetical protein
MSDPWNGADTYDVNTAYRRYLVVNNTVVPVDDGNGNPVAAGSSDVWIEPQGGRERQRPDEAGPAWMEKFPLHALSPIIQYS